MPPEAGEVRDWLEKAQRDRRAADLALNDSPPMADVAAFHCQQAIEKLLKAYLISREEDFERTHDLRMLTNLGIRHDAAFEGLRARVAPLNAFAVRRR